MAHAKEFGRVLFDSLDIPLRAHEIKDYDSLTGIVAGTPHAFEYWLRCRATTSGPGLVSITPDQ